MALSKTTQDHDEIRQWAEARGGKPAEVASTEHDGETGIIRFMFPNAPHHNDGALKEIEWDDFFEKFDKSGLALVYQDVTAEGAQSDFNKLIHPENASASAGGEKSAPAKKSTARKSPAKKTASTATKGAKTPAKKVPAKKAPAKKAPAKKVPAKRAPAKKAPAKSAAKKTSVKNAANKAPAKNTSGRGATKQAPARGAVSKTGKPAGKPKKPARSR